MIQKTIIDALHKEGKSQKVITERGVCSRSAVSKHIKCKVDWKWRNWVGKGAQATGVTASLRIQSSKADTCESFTRSELKLESVHHESPRSDVFRKRATKPLLNQKQCQKHLSWAVEKKNWTVAQWSKVLFSDKSKFCISFGNQGLESGGRSLLERVSSPKNYISVINYSPSCCSKPIRPPFIFGTQIKIFLMESESS